MYKKVLKNLIIIHFDLFLIYVLKNEIFSDVNIFSLIVASINFLWATYLKYFLNVDLLIFLWATYLKYFYLK